MMSLITFRRFRNLHHNCASLMQVCFYSKRVKRKQHMRDISEYDVISDYSWSGKRAYAFGFIATGALGVERLMLPPENRREHRLTGASYPIKLSHFCKNHSPISVACGFGFTLFICKHRRLGYGVYGCGINSDGQLGQLPCLEDELETGDKVYVVPAPSLVPLPLSKNELAEWKPSHVACGRAHSVVALHSLTSPTDCPIVFGLGNNVFGQCGRQIVPSEVFGPDGTTVTRLLLPKEVKGIVQVCCGQDHSLLLSTDGVVYSAGLGSDGQTGLGHFDLTDRFTPVGGAIRDLFVKQIASRGDTVLALTRCGRLFAWGNNEYGQIWPAADQLQVCQPIELPLDQFIIPPEAGEQNASVSIDQLSSIACAGSMCCFVTQTGHVFVWGFGCLGLGPKVNFTRLPTLIPPGLFNTASPGTSKQLHSVTGGLHHFVVRSNDGALWAWGAPRGGLYCLGLGNEVTARTDRQTYPLPLVIPAEVVDVACGVDHTIVLARSLA